MALSKIAIVGAGGFAREVAWLIRELNAVSPAYEFLGYLVSDVDQLTEHDSRREVLGDFRWLEKHSLDALAIGIGTPGPRGRVAAELQQRFPQITWPALIHPSVHLDRPTATLGPGVIVCAGVLGTVHLVLEAFALVNLGCTLGHESRIGRASVLNPTVNISGGVEVGPGVLIGTGAQVLQYVKVGEGATVGAGAVVTKDVAAGATVVGIPARPMQRERG